MRSVGSWLIQGLPLVGLPPAVHALLLLMSQGSGRQSFSACLPLHTGPLQESQCLLDGLAANGPHGVMSLANSEAFCA